MEVEKNVKVEFKNGFTLFGKIVDKSNAGIWLATEQETSFINYDVIRYIKEDKAHRGAISD